MTPRIASELALHQVRVANDDDETTTYETADGGVSIAVVRDRVWCVTAFESARVDSHELIGRTRHAIARLLGFPERTDPVTDEWLYTDGERRLEVYFSDDGAAGFVSDIDDAIFPTEWH